jgi:hypothetical protein
MKSTIVLISVCAFILQVFTGCGATNPPPEQEIRSLFAHDRSLDPEDRPPNVTQVEFGQTFASQVGRIELAMGAPKDTKIFPVKIHFTDHTGKEWFLDRWAFKDSFGAWKLANPNNPDPE